MTYCFFTAQYLPTPGGVERYTQNLARALTARGDKAVVVTSALPGLPAHETEENGPEIYRVKSLLLMNGRFPVALPGPGFSRAVEKALSGADRVVIQTRFYPLSVLAALRCHRRKKHFIVIDHGAGHLNMGSPLLTKCGEWYEHAVTAVLRDIVPGFYAVSRAGGEWLRHFGISAKGVLYNFIVPEYIHGLTADTLPEATRIKYALPEKRPVVLFTGRLVEEKGVLRLAEAAALLQTGENPPLVVFAGSGPLEEALRGYGGCVRVLGALPQKEVFCLLKAAQVFCLPSKSEGMSTSVLEAAACGCYVITTDRGGSKELVSGPEYGTILSDAQPDEIARAIEEALRDDTARSRAARAAAEKVEQQFTCAATCSALTALPWETL